MDMLCRGSSVGRKKKKRKSLNLYTRIRIKTEMIKKKKKSKKPWVRAIFFSLHTFDIYSNTE
jgi:hypothetical protein